MSLRQVVACVCNPVINSSVKLVHCQLAAIKVAVKIHVIDEILARIGSVEASKLKKMGDYDMLSWPQNV